MAAGAAVFLSACAKQVVGTTTALPGNAPTPSVGDAPSTIGAASAKGAVEAFLVAVNKQDLQGMSGLWGNANGLARDQLKREELEKRLIIIQCLLAHDRYRYVEESPRLSTGGRQNFQVELTKGSNKAIAPFTAVPSKGGRWLVEDVDVTKLREFCR
ncbi:MAG: hypothetical protein K2R93_20305 [Gemmatimonadaceae bacterium]|nr:hypothetical protein [Gemmatimonadaceae bacterium]